MANLKCSYDEIYALAEKTRKDANELDNHSKASTQELNAELSSWSGDASTEYKDNATMLSNGTQEVAEMMRSYADYLDEVADTVKEADDYCATARI